MSWSRRFSLPGSVPTLYVTFSASTGQNFVNVNWFQLS